MCRRDRSQIFSAIFARCGLWNYCLTVNKYWSIYKPRSVQAEERLCINPCLLYTSDVNAIYVFRSGRESYWHICFGDGSERDYRRSDLHIIESVSYTHLLVSCPLQFIKIPSLVFIIL